MIVEFKGDADVRVLRKTRRRRDESWAATARLQKWTTPNLPTSPSNPRVTRVMHDRPTFATLERTGLTTGAALVRQQMGLTGKGVGVAVIDSGITNSHDDLYRARPGASR